MEVLTQHRGSFSPCHLFELSFRWRRQRTFQSSASSDRPGFLLQAQPRQAFGSALRCTAACECVWPRYCWGRRSTVEKVVVAQEGHVYSRKYVPHDGRHHKLQQSGLQKTHQATSPRMGKLHNNGEAVHCWCWWGVGERHTSVGKRHTSGKAAHGWKAGPLVGSGTWAGTARGMQTHPRPYWATAAPGPLDTACRP